MENPYWGIAVDLSLVFRAKCDRGAEEKVTVRNAQAVDMKQPSQKPAPRKLKSIGNVNSTVPLT